MKKLLKNISIVALTSTLIFSCERELQQPAFDAILAANVLNTNADFQQAIDAAYSQIKGDGYFSTDTGNQLIVPDVMTDNLIFNPQGRGSNLGAYNWNLNSTNPSVVNLFGRGYAVISQANFPLVYIDKLPDGQDKTNIIAQARAIRAMVTFDLVKAYCKIPTQSTDANASLGIAYVTTFDSSNKLLSRDLNVGQDYDKIIEDLTFASNNLTMTSSNKGRLTKAAVDGILSRVYLYKGDYNNAIKYGNLAIAASPSVGSISKFSDMWHANDGDGTLFRVLNSTQENVTTGVAFQQGATALATSQIRSEYVVPKSFRDLYLATDVRNAVYFRTSAYQNTVRNHVIKYAFNPPQPLNVAEIKYMRTAEVYLNVAEAAYRKGGNEALANQLLNTLKSQRYTGYASQNLSGDPLLKEILLQRRLELAFENDRFYTLKRQGLPLQRTGEGPNIDGTGVASVVQTIAPNDFRWQWPIPRSATDLNANIKQNPGY